MVVRWIVAVFAVLWVIAMWYVVIYAIRRGWGPYFRSKRQPKTTVYARIKSKPGRHEVNPVNWQLEFTQKVLVFECRDGVERDYEVQDDIWDWVEVGDDGELTFQGDLFVGF